MDIIPRACDSRPFAHLYHGSLIVDCLCNKQESTLSVSGCLGSALVSSVTQCIYSVNEPDFVAPFTPLRSISSFCTFYNASISKLSPFSDPSTSRSKYCQLRLTYTQHSKVDHKLSPSIMEPLKSKYLLSTFSRPPL
jgi:hypothetical protein